MTQTLKSPFSCNYTDSSYAREYRAWTRVTVSMFLVPDRNFLCCLLLTHCRRPDELLAVEMFCSEMGGFPQGLMSWKIKVVPYLNYVRGSLTQKGIRARTVVQLRKAARGLQSSEDKRLMCMCQTPIAE